MAHKPCDAVINTPVKHFLWLIMVLFNKVIPNRVQQYRWLF